MLELEIAEKVIAMLVALLCNFVRQLGTQCKRSLCCEFQCMPVKSIKVFAADLRHL